MLIRWVMTMMQRVESIDYKEHVTYLAEACKLLWYERKLSLVTFRSGSLPLLLLLLSEEIPEY